MMASAGHTVKRIRLEWNLPEAAVARLVRDDARPFALFGRWAGGGAIIGSEPVRVAREADDPFALLDDHPLVDAPADPDGGAPGADGGGPVGEGGRPVAGGWIGYLGYGLGRRLEPVSPGPPSPSSLPDFALAYYDHVLRRDAAGQWWFEALWSEDAAPRLTARLNELRARAAAAPVAPRPFSTAPWQSTPGRMGHERAVQACRTRIHAGDLFQANICVRLRSEIDGDPLELFLAGAEELRPDRAAFLSGPWGAVASLSPELFLERRRNEVRSAPIKGTVRMPQDPRAAADARESLRSSAKDRAENVMIVDLVRNDLGRVCRPGSVSADVVAQPRAHTGVWHLVSEVSGTLAAGADNAALVRAAFPPGSVTGAPKVAALNVIAELESTSRHVYTGAIGFASPVARQLELSVAIRTFEFAPDGGQAWLGVGGGIVADSDPAAEGAECLTKAEPLLRAIGARLADEPAVPAHPALPAAPARPARPAAPAPPAHPAHPAVPAPHSTEATQTAQALPRPARRAPQPTSRPNPAAGVFETLLARDGEAVALDAHLDRLTASVNELYGARLPSDLRARITAVAEAVTSHARIRVDVRPAAPGGEDGAVADLEVSDPPLRTAPSALTPIVVPGGLGCHKWIDRRLLGAIASPIPGAEPLICDLDGHVLESARANVFIVTGDGTLVTPPTDGRILPGVTRADVLALANDLGIETEIRPLVLRELTAAAEVFLTGSLSGVEPALGPGNDDLRTAGSLTQTLRTNLYKSPPAAILR